MSEPILPDTHIEITEQVMAHDEWVMALKHYEYLSQSRMPDGTPTKRAMSKRQAKERDKAWQRYVDLHTAYRAKYYPEEPDQAQLSFF